MTPDLYCTALPSYLLGPYTTLSERANITSSKHGKMHRIFKYLICEVQGWLVAELTCLADDYLRAGISKFFLKQPESKHFRL